MEEENDPYLEAFNNIMNQTQNFNQNQEDQKETKDNIFDLFTPNLSDKVAVLDNQKIDNKIEEAPKIDNLNSNNNINNNINHSQTITNNSNKTFLSRKTRPDNEINYPKSDLSQTPINTISKKENKENFYCCTIDTIINDKIEKNKSQNQNKNQRVYDYGYTIELGEDNERGCLMDEFLKKEITVSTNDDFFNFHLDEKKWIKIVNHTIYAHYERHLKEIMDQKLKEQQILNYYKNQKNFLVNYSGNNYYYNYNSNMRPMVNIQNMNFNIKK